MYAFDHIRRFYWHHCTTDPSRFVREQLFHIYWRYMLRC
ncbi:hypothetical protein ACVL91_001029 [Bradyrhizobium elkanii]|uniref:Uncharacterized protein n=1 Tax=Bradyrhizobium elkanii TaxID=29448 RepID=A0A8I2C689_BRAEL|nr:hypothetical protein [Bradyrhizobium elkanii]